MGQASGHKGAAGVAGNGVDSVACGSRGDHGGGRGIGGRLSTVQVQMAGSRPIGAWASMGMRLAAGSDKCV